MIIMKRIKAAVVGAGIYGSHHINAYLNNEKTELVGVCDLDPKILAKVEEEYSINTYTDLEELIKKEKPDIISIATPDPYHFGPAKTAIENNIDVLVEKPLATNRKECEELIKLAELHNVKVGVDFHKRWDPAYLAIKEEIENEKAKKIIRGYISLDDIIDVPLKWFNWAHKSSPVWFLGIHCYDLIRFITKSEVSEVYAVGSKELLNSKGISTYDSMQAVLTMTDGSNWTVENSWILPNGFPKANDGQLIILTENRYFKNESYRGINYYTETTQKIPNYLFMNYENGKASGFGLEPINDFVDDIISGKKFKADGTDGLRASEIAHAVHLSVEKGCKIKMNDIY